MGLFDRFKKKDTEPAKPVAPEAVAAETDTGVLCAPASGRVVAMAEVPDPVFSGEVLGKGCAVWPEEDVVYAPASGTVSVAMPHAVAIETADGVEALVHVGVDTVDMSGDGFETFVAQGASVVAGQPIVRIDRKKIEAAGHPDCVVLAVSNTADFEAVELLAESGSHVDAGKALVRASR